MEGKYSNNFSVAVNPSMHEVIITFKQDIPNHVITTTGGDKEIIPAANDINDVARIVLTLPCAQNLSNALYGCLEQLKGTVNG